MNRQRIKKKRLNFDISAEEMREIDQLVMATRKITRANLVRSALSLYKMVAEMRRDGYKLQLRKGNRTKDIVLLSG